MVHCVVVTICPLPDSKALDTGNVGTIADDGNCANDGCGRGFFSGLGPIGVDEENDTEGDTEDELGDETEDEGAVVGDEESDGDCDRKKSAVFLHLLSHPKCLQVYDDFSFSVLCRARYASQLKVLEAVCIRLHKPDLCKQKKHVVALKLFS